jgi:hypothetical protein
LTETDESAFDQEENPIKDENIDGMHKQGNTKQDVAKSNKEKEVGRLPKSPKGNTIDRGKETLFEQFHTLGSIKKTSTWGDRQILERCQGGS